MSTPETTQAKKMTDTTDTQRGAGLTTDELIDMFAAVLRDKANAAEAKYGWNDGWLNPDAVDAMRGSLYRHLGKGDPRDVAIYCAFLWFHDASTHPTEASSPASEEDGCE